MPIAMVFTLQPTIAAEVHRSLGRSAHAAILDLLGMAEPTLPDQLHAPTSVRPLTVSNLLDRRDRRPLTRVMPSECYRLRVTLLSDALEAVGRRWLARPPAQIALGGAAWRVLDITADHGRDLWAGEMSYADLASQALRAPAEEIGPWRLAFAAPVYFRRQGSCMPLPTAGLVFGSLFDRWNALSGFPLPEELRERLDEGLLLSDFQLQSAAAPTKHDIAQIGAVGSCVYRLRRELAAYRSAIALLAQFAFYSGVGAGTARGFGQVRLIGPGERVIQEAYRGAAD